MYAVVETRGVETKKNMLVKMGHSRKHPYHPHRGNRKLTPYPLWMSLLLIHLLLSETIFSSLPLRTAEISSVGGSMDLFWNDPMLIIMDDP
jgi:hypothetical protein